MTFNEIARGDGTIEVEVGERKLTCPVCGHQQFHERNSLLNTRMAKLFNVDWANRLQVIGGARGKDPARAAERGPHPPSRQRRG